MKNILLYLALFILIILLLLPPGLRMFGKNLFSGKKVSTIKDELEILSCTKINESISTTFMNGKAYNIKYEISGNHVSAVETEEIEENKLPDETSENDLNSEINHEVQNSIIDDFTDYAQIKYIEDKNLTEYRIAVNLLDVIPEKLQNHTKSISEVESFYRDLSFSCTKQKY